MRSGGFACGDSLALAALVAPARIGVLNLLVPVLACVLTRRLAAHRRPDNPAA
jgi:hypothetical protein